MKKFASILLIIVLVFAVSACAPKTNEPDKTTPSDTNTNTTMPSEQGTEPETSTTTPAGEGKTLELDTATITLTNAMELTTNLLDEPVVRVPDVFKASFSVTDEDYEEAASSWEEGVSGNKDFMKIELTVDDQPATVLAYLTETGTDVQVFVKQPDGKALNIMVLEDNSAKPLKPEEMIGNEHFMGLLEGIKLK